jgi:hypothetical protein
LQQDETMSSFVIAHGSGIDDIAWFVVPVAVVLISLRIAERRARSKTQGVPEAGDEDAD